MFTSHSCMNLFHICSVPIAFSVKFRSKRIEGVIVPTKSATANTVHVDSFICPYNWVTNLIFETPAQIILAGVHT